MANKDKRQYWKTPLHKPVDVNDREQPLSTLRDAGDYLAEHWTFTGRTKDDVLHHAVTLLLQAAKTGSPADAAAFTEQLMILLEKERLIGERRPPKATGRARKRVAR